MKLKRIFAVATVIAVCFSIFTGCYTDTGDSTPSSMYEMSSYETASTVTVPKAKYDVTLSKTFDDWIVSDYDAYVLMMTSNTTTVQVFKVADLTNANWDEALPYLKQDIEENYVNVDYSEENASVTVGGYEAKKCTYTGDQKGLYIGKSDENTLFHNSTYAVIIGNELYIIRANCQEARYEQMKDVLSEIVNSIQFTPVA